MVGVVIITGANSGIGFRAAEILAGTGRTIIAACRDDGRGNAAVARIKAVNKNADVIYHKVRSDHTGLWMWGPGFSVLGTSDRLSKSQKGQLP